MPSLAVRELIAKSIKRMESFILLIFSVFSMKSKNNKSLISGKYERMNCRELFGACPPWLRGCHGNG
jgi:hypothetical protein